jgi:hypothetical protein
MRVKEILGIISINSSSSETIVVNGIEIVVHHQVVRLVPIRLDRNREAGPCRRSGKSKQQKELNRQVIFDCQFMLNCFQIFRISRKTFFEIFILLSVISQSETLKITFKR